MSSNGSAIQLSRQSRQKHMYALIEEYKDGDLSRHEICEREKITVGKFSWWVSKYNREMKVGSNSKSSSPPAFIEVKSPGERACKELRLSDIEIIYPGDIRLRVLREVDLVTLQSLLKLGKGI